MLQRVTVYLDEALLKYLKNTAKARGISVSALAREMLHEYFQKETIAGNLKKATAS
jgi:predicted DNA binding CopG/RHH family protein